MNFTTADDNRMWITTLEAAGVTVQQDENGILTFFRDGQQLNISEAVIIADGFRRQQIQELERAMNANTQLNPPTTAAPPIPAAPTAPTAAQPPMPTVRPRQPDVFNGQYDAALVENFAFSVRNYLNLTAYPPDTSVALVSGFLSGPALTWYQSRLRENGNSFPTIEVLLTELENEFRPLDLERNIYDQLEKLIERPRQTARYVTAFRQICLQLKDSENQGVKKLFENGLRTETFEYVKLGKCETLREMMEAALDFDEVQRHRQRGQTENFNVRRRLQPREITNAVAAYNQNTMNAPAAPHGDPMDIGRIELRPARTDGERAEYRRLGLCFHCGDHGHLGKDCPKRLGFQKGQ